MDEIEKRLRETSEHCYNCYDTWQKDKKSAGASEALIESIHELRKVASRLEIELAISERSKVTQKPIPIPPHRDAQRRPKENADNEAHDNRGNREQSISDSSKSGGTKRRRPPSKKPSDS